MEYKNSKLNFVKNINEAENIADMLLFGEIGSEKREGMINGDDFAREMVFLSEIGFKSVRLNINSVGGGIVKGMSIINAMNVVRMNGCSIETSIVGIADSMAGMISAFGDKGKRTVANFGSGVVHEPMAQNKDGSVTTIDEMEDGTLKNEALNMRESLIDLMTSSTGKEKDIVKEVMSKGVRLNATQLKDFGMVDKIVSLSNEGIDIQNKTAIELMAACSKIEVKPKTKKMNLVNKTLSLKEDAAENSAVEAIQALQNKVKDQTDSITEKDAKILKLEGEKEALVNKAKETADAQAEAYVDALIDAGKLSDKNRDSLVNQAKENFEGFKSITDSLEVTFVDVTKEMNQGKEGGPSASEKDAMEFHKHNVAGTLANLEKESPVKYKRLETAYVNSNIDFDNVK